MYSYYFVRVAVALRNLIRLAKKSIETLNFWQDISPRSCQETQESQDFDTKSKIVKIY